MGVGAHARAHNTAARALCGFGSTQGALPRARARTHKHTTIFQFPQREAKKRGVRRGAALPARQRVFKIISVVAVNHARERA